MKYVLLMLMIVSSNTITAQFSVPPAGHVVTHPELDKFEGNWRYVNGQDTICFVFKRQLYQYSFPSGNVTVDYSEEELSGWAIVKHGDSLVYNDVRFAVTTPTAQRLGDVNRTVRLYSITDMALACLLYTSPSPRD